MCRIELMDALIDIGKLLSQESKVTLILFFLCGLAFWAYWKEKKRNDKSQEERLKEAREDTKAMTGALVGVKNTIQSFKDTLDAIAPHLPRR